MNTTPLGGRRFGACLSAVCHALSTGPHLGRLSRFGAVTLAAAIAVNEQRVANNIKSVVSTDEFGSIPDDNPGEFLKWLPGVGVEYFANNITGVNVRGLGSVNTEINFDGMPIASANADGTSR